LRRGKILIEKVFGVCENVGPKKNIKPGFRPAISARLTETQGTNMAVVGDTPQ